MGESTIINWIIPFLSVGKRGFSSKYYFAKIIQLIFKRLKTGVQWRELPIESYFEEGEISWQNVYYYFNKLILYIFQYAKFMKLFKLFK